MMRGLTADKGDDSGDGVWTLVGEGVGLTTRGRNGLMEVRSGTGDYATEGATG